MIFWPSKREGFNVGPFFGKRKILSGAPKTFFFLGGVFFLGGKQKEFMEYFK